MNEAAIDFQQGTDSTPSNAITKGTGLAPGAATLAAAVIAVSAVAHEGRSADIALQAADERGDRAAVRAIALGTLRWYLRLAPALAKLVNRPALDMPPLLRGLLIAAAHQIEYSRAAPEVCVHLAVDAARALGLPRATGFVNAVLRRFVRERVELLAAVDADLATRHAYPEWLTLQLMTAWPEHCAAILQASNEHPPMTLRVATAAAREPYLAELAAAGREGELIKDFAEAVLLRHSAPVTALPGFAEGRVSVQDAGAQLAALLLDARAGDRVLDACAAPGGKSAHILQRQPKVDLLAVDDDAARLALVTATFSRIGAKPQSARTRLVDLTQSDALADEAFFDRILVDAPCSATGVIRRHPDIKLLRRSEDIAGFARLQRRILERCFARLAPDGRLVYSTCSILPAENERMLGDFLEATPSARVLPWPSGLTLPSGAIRQNIGVQLLPGSGPASTDGFYYACLGRVEDA
ncbi:MAG: 16S rRNA (cytosine(967)-C(5))-methyltransferase RsmB [Gammaproteobacteria bacterium]